MRHFFIRVQLVLVSVLLLLSLGMVMFLVMRNNYRWDLTQEKIYSIPEGMAGIFDRLRNESIEVMAFYPHDDPARANFEIFLKQCQLRHRKFKYNFYDPDRVPNLAKQYQVKEFYTVILKMGDRHESLVGPSEETFSNALLRLSNPKRFGICFVTGHGEAPLTETNRNGLSQIKGTLEGLNYTVHEVILLRDQVPPFCNVIAVGGPHHDFDPFEFKLLAKAFDSGRGIFFAIDPMDPGTGKAFADFIKTYGVLLGDDVVVDKMSRLVGGDFLVPLVGQYIADHPITAKFAKPTFFPVARTVQPSGEEGSRFEIMPLALTGEGSWAETDLAGLEKGDAAFEPDQADLAGPLSLAVAVEARSKKDSEGSPDLSSAGRLVVIGDSDFLTNAYVGLSGNNDFLLSMIQWLTKDERFISIPVKETKFKLLLLTSQQRFWMLVFNIAVLPLFFLLAGGLWVILRRRTV